MEIFDDLVQELKEEQLLEETVIEEIEKSDSEILSVKNPKDTSVNSNQQKVEKTSMPEESGLSVDPSSANEGIFANETEQSKDFSPEETDKSEYFCKRAIEEVSFLQMVEVVLSGVEREQLKVVSKPYDDLKVKKLLHEFIQISKENNLAKQADYEFQLLKETENWYQALSERDRTISIGHLRRFCENTRPALSSSALVSLSRFYRNSPFSEGIRNKFDLIITRVFSKDVGSEKREFVFSRQEIIDHISGLYAEWKCVSLYSTEDDNPEILGIISQFEKFIAEAEKAESFKELVNSSYFDRLRKFKRSTNENFYVPGVVAVAIECNIRVGNSYVKLIEMEREKQNSQKLDEQYGQIIDKVVSDVTSKTLQLVDILEEKGIHADAQSDQNKTKKAKRKTATGEKGSLLENFSNLFNTSKLFKVNRWLLILAGITVIVTFGLYSWVEFAGETPEKPKNVVVLNFKGTELEKNLKAPRISNGILYAVVNENWAGLSKEEKEKVVSQAVSFGIKEKAPKVHLFNKEGKTVGAGTKEKVFVREDKQ